MRDDARGLRARAIDALTDPTYAAIVDLVAWPERDGDGLCIGVANSAGAARLDADGAAEIRRGRNPVAAQDPMAFLPYSREIDDPSPTNERNTYPRAADRLRSVFDDQTRSPDLVVVHTPTHYFPERGGHVGEHGSLDVIQSRAPLLLSGAGVRRRGLLDSWARLVDVGPTLAWLAGAEPRLLDGSGRPLDGLPLTDLVAPGATYVVGVLWDGAHCGDLLHLAGRGDLPAVARLLESGCALAGGAIAEFPSVTLTNHASILTGVGPGRHGVLGNVYYDRATRERVVPNDATTWHRSAEWLRPGVRTVFEQVAAARREAVTACIDEAVDRGATYSTMARVRQSGHDSGADALTAQFPDPMASRFLGERSHLRDDYYAWSTQVDDLGVTQVMELWRDAVRAPALTWWAHTVTDAGHHAGGPRSAIARDSFRDADRRLGAFLDHLDSLGVTDDVVVLLTADHGFEGSVASCRGDWDEALRAAGIPFRDEGPGLVYLGTDHAAG